MTQWLVPRAKAWTDTGQRPVTGVQVGMQETAGALVGGLVSKDAVDA